MSPLPTGWYIAIVCLVAIALAIVAYLYVKSVYNKKKSLRDTEVNDSYSRISD